jgi:hypothetical protein
MTPGTVKLPAEDTETEKINLKSSRDRLRFCWSKHSFPIKVLLGPQLRLRYRVAWETASDQINVVIGRVVLDKPIEACHHEAYEIEVEGHRPSTNSVYVCDCKCKTAFTGSTTYYFDANDKIDAAKVMLPEAEENPFLFMGVALHEALHCIGLMHTDDPNSVMYPVPVDRSQTLSREDMELLIKYYC